MFETIAQSSRVSARRRVLAVLTSMAAHTAAILVLVVVPLLLVDAFPASRLLTILFAPPPPRPQRPAPHRTSSGVQESKLVHRVDPVYPDLARRARISGVVILEVTVDEEGNVADIRVLRGHPLLDEEAVRAVRQWKYSPTLLSGEPVPVIATVTVIFNLR